MPRGIQSEIGGIAGLGDQAAGGVDVVHVEHCGGALMSVGGLTEFDRGFAVASGFHGVPRCL